MNKYQKEVEKQLLDNEKKILRQLEKNYIKALKDVKLSIRSLIGEGVQSKIYRRQYQENLEKQLQSSIDLLSTKNYSNITEYLKDTYKDGFIGTIYNMQHEGIPFIMQINQEAVLRSIMRETENIKLSDRIYRNADKLKKIVKSDITRGLSKSSSYAEMARNISSHSEASLKQAYRIARTEGGRVTTEAEFEAMQRAKINGADILKQWDATLDRRTRVTHAMLDGQVRELEEPFEVSGLKAMYPTRFWYCFRGYKL